MGLGAKVVCFLALCAACMQTLRAQGSYTAAVLEHAPSKLDTPRNTILKNLELYKEYADRARQQNADIIVFPEYGLTTLVEDPSEYAIVLGNSSGYEDKVIQELRTAAIEQGIYLVVNLLEKDFDAKNKTIYYNTNLVFNRQGSIVAKYRKINLFNEPNLTPGNDTVTFTTDFGVNFGIFTCWDIVYQKPSRDIFNYGNVTDVIYPLAWFSTMPFYVATSVQQAYAQANGVNLLAANYDRPRSGNGGSGIYGSNGGVIEDYIDSTLSTKLIVQAVGKNSQRTNTRCNAAVARNLPGGGGLGIPATNITNFVTHKDFKSSDYAFENVDLSKDDISQEICDKNFCCVFNITLGQTNNNEVYKLMAYDGKAQLDKFTGHVRICSLLSCKTDDVSSCGERINGTTKFARISVSGNLPFDNGTFYQPSTLTYDLQPVANTRYCSNEGNGTTASVRLYSTQTQDRLLVFGLYGRVSSASVPQALGAFLVVLLAAVKLLVF